MSQPEPQSGHLLKPRLPGGSAKDAVGPLIVLFVTLVPGVFRQLDSGMPLYAWALLAAGPLSLLVWRRFPRAVMLVAVASVAAVAHLELGLLVAVPALVAIALCMYTGNRTLTIGVVVLLSAAVTLGKWRGNGWVLDGEVVRESMLVIGWLHVAMISGLSRRQREAYIAEAEHTKEEAVKRKAADERVRIARELHDSLTHSISVIRVQAGVALHLARKRGEEPPPALAAIDEAAKDATRELRETLSMLRDDEGPRLAGVKSLVERYRGSGLEIEVDCDGCEDLELDPEVDHAAYRIVQEALTNAVRHSGGDRVEVRIALEGEELVVEVADNGTPGEFEPGRGLTGMRERVDALDGALSVGGGHGFRVSARLPARPGPGGAGEGGEERPVGAGAAEAKGESA